MINFFVFCTWLKLRIKAYVADSGQINGIVEKKFYNVNDNPSPGFAPGDTQKAEPVVQYHFTIGDCTNRSA